MNMDLAMFFVKRGFREINILYDLTEDTWEVHIIGPHHILTLSRRGNTPYDCFRELKEELVTNEEQYALYT